MNENLNEVIRDYWTMKLPPLKARDTDIQLKSDLISDIIGPRRAGKTYMLFGTAAKLPRKTTIYINFENRRLANVDGNIFNDIVEFIHSEKLMELHPRILLFLDEVQRIRGWERYVRSIQDEFKGHIKIFVTGSSSELLASDAAKLLTGRHLTTLVLPLSFQEFLAFREFNADPQTERGRVLMGKELDEFVHRGGYPEVAVSEDWQKLLNQLYDDVLSRDVITRSGHRGAHIIREFSDYLMANTGNLLSFSKMSKYLASRDIHITTPTLIKYFGMLKSAYICFDVTIHSAKIRDRMKYPRKIYAFDSGFASITGEAGLGRLYENTVAVELLRRGHEPRYWKDRAGYEVDFVVGRTRKTEAIQVCYDLSDPDVRKRELRGLERCMDELEISEGLVITRDEEGTADAGGRTVRIVPLWKWLGNLITAIKSFT
ncbi:MAG: ATP-binding protein [Candidatus Thermoplasmatota archaeon]|nr:ATP-binding protein [Euryarchaeota archaeon]MBU4032726.1 ATP-binding protein [Candidatus Thermoplasmatota archaeon]MBU4072274.1 ATP-binding protein [Candidatus Thermoplasmatota archaeon]MBU4144238.1 ATP-binding protein [Candidatus Thermoplasmatota archaeon]MBU4591419.1 ATP-binding protein [Candidatus Thermoplasmatota archaeon]